jgi:hypothetical protein
VGGPIDDDAAHADGSADDGSDRSDRADRLEDDLLASYAEALADGVEQALPGWVAAAVARRLPGAELAGWREDIEDAGREAASDVGPRVRELLRLDVDEQWTNPLTLIRSAIRYPNRILTAAGAPEVLRDRQAARFLPEDVYDLAPAAFADLDPDLHDVGIGWGAAKAHIHLRRRRQEQVD